MNPNAGRGGKWIEKGFNILIASGTCENVKNFTKITKSQARELSKVEPEKQAEVYQSVIDKTEGKPTG